MGANEIALLIDRHANALTLYARQWTNNPEDCVQEAFVELAAAIRPNHPSAWLFRVVRNKSINDARSSVRRRRHEGAAAERTTNVATPDLKLQQQEEQKRLIDCLDRLNDDSRELIVLRIWSGLTWGQISEVTRLSIGTAHRQYQRALEQLKSIFETIMVE